MNMTLKLRNDGTSITGIVIEAAEKHYGAKFVMDTSVRASPDASWVGPVALFYGPTEHPVSKSRYFALRVPPSCKSGEQTVYIMNGQSAADHIYVGLVYRGEVYHSRYVHDYRSVGGDAIDGGLDYTRLIGLTLPTIKFKIVDGEPVFIEEETKTEPLDIPGFVPLDEFDMDKIFDQYDNNTPEKFWK